MVFAKASANAPLLDFWIPPMEHCPELTDDGYSEGSDIFCTGADSDDEFPESNNQTEEWPTTYTQSDFEQECEGHTAQVADVDPAYDYPDYAEAYTEQEMAAYHIDVEKDEDDYTGYTDEQCDFIHGIEDEHGEFWHGYCSDGGSWHKAYYDDDGEWYSEYNDQEEEGQEEEQPLEGDSQLRYEEGYDDEYPGEEQ